VVRPAGSATAGLLPGVGHCIDVNLYPTTMLLPKPLLLLLLQLVLPCVPLLLLLLCRIGWHGVSVI
jgi:hypothetical protein